MNLETLTTTIHSAALEGTDSETLQNAIDVVFSRNSDEWRANLFATVWDSDRTYGSILSILSRSLSNV